MNNVIHIYKRELFEFLKSIGRLEDLVPDNILEDVYNNNYLVSGWGNSAIYITEGTKVIYELKLEDLQIEDITLKIVTSGYARCPKCNSDDISYERITPDGKGEWVCWECEWSVSGEYK